jgi:acetolactate decarboxylase
MTNVCRGNLKIRIFHALFIILFIVSASTAAEKATPIYQVSTAVALKQGDYAGKITFGELKTHGDMGLGSVDGLDGEMIGLDGKFYQVKSDGQVVEIKDDVKTPFAMVAFGEKSGPRSISGIDHGDQMVNVLNLMTSEKGIFAIKIAGKFKSLKLRSVPKQEQPFQPLDKVLEKQVMFDVSDIKGAMVGFRVPPEMEILNGQGYHFHFISDDRTKGGHVLNCSIESAQVFIQKADEILIRLTGN